MVRPCRCFLLDLAGALPCPQIFLPMSKSWAFLKIWAFINIYSKYVIKKGKKSCKLNIHITQYIHKIIVVIPVIYIFNLVFRHSIVKRRFHFPLSFEFLRYRVFSGGTQRCALSCKIHSLKINKCKKFKENICTLV